MNKFGREFLIEGGELLDQLDRDFLKLENAPESEELLVSELDEIADEIVRRIGAMQDSAKDVTVD